MKQRMTLSVCLLMLLMLLCMAVTGLVDKDEDDMGGMMA